jgi:hypothetical protein
VDELTNYTSIEVQQFITKVQDLTTFIITTLALGSGPKQGHGKMWAENVTRESHLHSWECERM